MQYKETFKQNTQEKILEFFFLQVRTIGDKKIKGSSN